MDYLQVPNITSCAQARAVEAGRKMQASIIDAANKDGRDPPKYDLLELIGKGSFGLVYKGKDVTTADVVAIKIIDVDESDIANPRNTDSYSEFLKEISALKLMRENKARNINHVIEALSVGKTMWIITDYCGGGSVATLMKPTSPGGLQEKWIIPILREVALAIKWVHKAGIIHRDIKCANVLVTEQGEVKLCDFGVAGILESKKEKRSTFIGTLHWMAPELFDTTLSYGKEVDIWAFGSMVYEIATGFPPNVKSGVSYGELGSHLKTNAPRLEGDNFSKELKSLAAYCLELSPSSRPTIEQIQRHAYLRNSDSTHPTSILSELVKDYVLWERRGNVRESLIMLSEAQEPVEKVNTEEWIFTTTAAFDKTTALGVPEQDIQEASRRQIEDISPACLGTFDQQSLLGSSRRLPPAQALAPHQSPLEKAFDPNTTSNYEDNCQHYYSPSSEVSEFDFRVPNHNVKPSLQESLIDLGDLDSTTLRDLSSIGLGIKGMPERRPTWPIEENSYISTAASLAKPIRSGSDSTAYQRTLDWKFPSLEEQAKLRDSHDPAEDEMPYYVEESHTRDRPTLIDCPTDPTGTQLKSGAMPSPDPGDWFARRESLIDLDLSIPQFSSPFSSMSNSEFDSMTPRRPFEMGSPNPAIARHIREPSLYVDDDALPCVSVQGGNIVNTPTQFAGINVYGASPLFETEEISKISPPLPEPAPEARAQGGTFTQFPDLPKPPSAAALSGQLSNYDMVKEVSRMFDGLTEQLTAFRDVYNSPAITSKKTAKSKSRSTTEKMDSTG